MRENSLGVVSVCDEIVSSYAQFAKKSFPRMLSMRMLLVSKITQKYQIENATFEYIKILKNRLGTHQRNRTKVNMLKENKFLMARQKNLVPRILSHRGNVRTSKF